MQVASLGHVLRSRFMGLVLCINLETGTRKFLQVWNDNES